jgi:membrane protein involved in colicin uptake
MYRGAAVATTAAVTSAAATSAAAASAASANAAASAAAAAQRAPAPGAAVPVGTIVPNLPSGCSSIVIGGVNYFNCAGVYYRAGFQGNNIVYIVSAP